VGFHIVGSYSPYKDTTIIVITNDELRVTAALSEFGGFGAIQRVTLTKVNDVVQVSYTNPIYMAHVYRLKKGLYNVADKLEKTLGKQIDYGANSGLSKEKLRDYQYKWLMPYFTDRLELAAYDSHDNALSKIEDLLKNKKNGVEKVYQVKISNNDTVIGVHLTGKSGNDCSGDEYIMSRIDFKKIKSSGHLPYEIVVSKGKVFTLPAEFRIAINFPDLSMVGSNSFASIMCAPSEIQAALTKATGGTPEEF
jgi:hypothetical protein